MYKHIQNTSLKLYEIQVANVGTGMLLIRSNKNQSTHISYEITVQAVQHWCLWTKLLLSTLVSYVLIFHYIIFGCVIDCAEEDHDCVLLFGSSDMGWVVRVVRRADSEMQHRCGLTGAVGGHNGKIHPQAHAFTHTHTNTHACTKTHMHTHIQTHTHTHTPIQRYTHTRKHAHVHTHTHTHTIYMLIPVCQCYVDMYHFFFFFLLFFLVLEYPAASKHLLYCGKCITMYFVA